VNVILDSLSYEIGGFFICFAAGVGMCICILLTTHLLKWKTRENEGARRPPTALMLLDIMWGIAWGVILFLVMLKFNGAELRVYNFAATAAGAGAVLFIKSKILKGKTR